MGTLMKCPCGSGKDYDSCCGPYILGKENPPTPEALMRSRYTAFTQRNLEYIEATMRGEALERFDRKGGEGIQWIKLDVLLSEENGDQGMVQFIATFRFQGKKQMMHETSFFKKINGKWYYVKGIVS
ncbi:MAG: SEC-C domain-containing protein [Chlamydiia bacterium]|nr:SEC-C domain-containing protein [Chlamydiia bacterium]